jgi:hypothetical protein
MRSFVFCHKVNGNSLLTIPLMCSLSIQRHRFHDEKSVVRVFTIKVTILCTTGDPRQLNEKQQVVRVNTEPG